MRRGSPLNRSLLLVSLVGGLLILGGGAGVALADGEYDLTVPDAVDTPPRTVENPFNEDITDEIDAFAVIESGESIDVEVSAPSDEKYRLDFYSDDGFEGDGTKGEGSGSATIDGSNTDLLSPGTYSLALDPESGSGLQDLQAFHPVVVSGYDVEFTVPAEDPEAGGTLEIDDISVTPTELSEDPAGVEVVVWNDDHVEQFDATGSDGSYAATVDLDGLETGEYNVHVAAVGEDEFRGQPEVLGLSESKNIEVVESSDESGSDDGAETGGAPGGGGGAGAEPVNDEDPTDDNESDSNADADNETDAPPTEPTETVELLDEAPDEPGVRVSFENATARTVTLSNESASGNVTVTDRSGPPAEASPPAGSPIATVEITVPESERDAPATIELAVDADAVDDAERLAVEKYHPENDSWTQLETSVAETTPTTVTLVTETPGFSVFAVTETSESTSGADDDGTETGGGTNSSGDADDSTSDESGDDVITPSDSSESTADPDGQPEEQPGFGLVTAAVALSLAVAGLGCSRRLRSSG